MRQNEREREITEYGGAVASGQNPRKRRKRKGMKKGGKTTARKEMSSETAKH